MDKVTLTRDQLYELVWSKPITVLAKEFGLSDNDFRKICKNHNIPLPYMGYWSKLRHGKPVRKVMLPTSIEGTEIIISPPNENPQANQNEFISRTILMKEIEPKYKNLLQVPARLTNPDDLIVKARDALTINKKYYSKNGLIRPHSGYLSINVDPINVPRALRFMDALIKLLKARGHDVNVGHAESRVVVFDEELVIHLQEKLKYEYVIEGKYNWKTRHEHPTGIFMLRTWKTFHWHQKVWSDGKVLIENQLEKIVVGIELLAQKEKAKQIELEEFWAQQDEEQRIKKERHDREELDSANFQKLLAQSQIWKQSQVLCEFISAIESKLIASEELTNESREWLGWAKEKAEKFNPLNDLSV